jgi:peptide-methionine (S)-S-oxide reductase
VQADFNDAELSYEGLCRLFFKAHEPSMGSPKRQYMSAIFAHTDEQFETASRVLHEVKQSKTRVSTLVEMATDFYEGEYYHQKWLLQRKADWFKRLGMTDPRELVEGEAAAKLNAYVAGHVTHDEMRELVNGWAKNGVVTQDTYERLSFYLN